MNDLILQDAQAAPHLFFWNGPVDRREIDEWTARRGWLIPDDLSEFWATTGGGEIFEGETLLRPLISPDGQEEVAQELQTGATIGECLAILLCFTRVLV
jgi:hypothetical protein